MNENSDDNLFLDLIETVALDVLARIGDDLDARYRFCKRFVTLAQEKVRQAEARRAAVPH